MSCLCTALPPERRKCSNPKSALWFSNGATWRRNEPQNKKDLGGICKLLNYWYSWVKLPPSPVSKVCFTYSWCSLPYPWQWLKGVNWVYSITLGLSFYLWIKTMVVNCSLIQSDGFWTHQTIVLYIWPNDLADWRAGNISLLRNGNNTGQRSLIYTHITACFLTSEEE